MAGFLDAIRDPEFYSVDLLNSLLAYYSDPENALRTAALASMAAPPVSGALDLGADALMYARKPEERNLLNYGLTAAGVAGMAVPGAVAAKRAAKGADEAIDTFKRAQRANAPKSVATLWDSVSDVDEAMRMAQKNAHLKIDTSTGKYIGGPESITSPQALAAQRRKVLESVDRGSWNADWYLRQRDLAQSLAVDPVMQSLFARGTSAYSPQAMPMSELDWFTRQHNAKMLTGADIVPKTKSQAATVGRAYHEGPSGSYTFTPGDVRLGRKTGPYASAKDPTVPESSLYKTANDIWHGRVMGYGDDFSRGFTPQEHGYLTGENLRLAQAATDVGIPVGGHGLIPHTPRTAQAATWGDVRFQQYKEEDIARFTEQAKRRDAYERNPEKWRKAHPGKSPPSKPAPLASDEELRAKSMRGVDSAADNQMAYLTNEAVTGQSVGHLPGMTGWDLAERVGYTDAVRKLTGRDPTLEALQLFAKDPITTVGQYTNKAGLLEQNPGWADPVLAAFVGGKGGRQFSLPASDRSALDMSAHIGGYVRGQEAGAWSRFVPERGGMKAGEMNAVALRNPTPAQREQVAAFVKQSGIDMIDQGDQLLLTKFGGTPLNATETSKAMNRSGISTRSGQLYRGLLESNAPDTMGNLVGTGKYTEALLEKIGRSGINKVWERLDASRWSSVADAMNKLDKSVSEIKNVPLRDDLMKARDIIAKTGISGLRDYVAKFGSSGLPALAAVGLLPLLLSAQGGDREGL